MPHKPDILESIRQKASMSKQIVTNKDAEYGWYAGGSFEIESKAAKIDLLLKLNLIPEKYIPMVKLYRLHLDQQRKAFFASVGCTEISKLGFILGLADDRIRAIK